MANPAVSVIVPVYNAEHYVEQALTSLADQTLDSLEVVVVLDAPTDSSAALVESLVESDDRFQVIPLRQNIGLAGARMIGLDAASGDFVGFLDADDWADPDMYARLHDGAVSQHADIAGAAHRRVTPTGVTEVPFPVPASALSDRQSIRAALTHGHSNRMLWFACRSIFRRAMLVEGGIGFDERLRTGEDMVFNLRAFGAADKVAVLDDVLLNYRETPNSLTMSPHLSFVADSLQLSYDLKLQAARELGLGPDFERDLNRYVIENSFPRLLSNALADPTATSPRRAVRAVLTLPMVREAAADVPLRGSGLPRGIAARLALAKARQPLALSVLHRRSSAAAHGDLARGSRRPLSD